MIQQTFKSLIYENFLIILNSSRTDKERRRDFHLGPESSMAWTNKDESSVRSEYLSDEEKS